MSRAESTRRPLRLVLDTNVVLDLLVFADSRLAPIAAALADTRAEWIADGEALGELERVLSYPELRLTAAAASATMARAAALAKRVATPAETRVLPRCRDADDQKFLVLAVAVGADFLLSRDRAVLTMARRMRSISPALSIVTPEVLSNRLRSSDGLG